jgi:drug/metabolite transporter (DMT)-like permease
MGGKELALVTALSFGFNPVTLKMGFARGGRTDVAVVVGLVVAIPIYLLISPLWGGLHLEQLTLVAVAGFVLAGLFGGGLGRRWMYVAIDKLGAAPATAIKNAAPVVTTIIAVTLLGESITGQQVLAILAVVAGITLVTWQKGQSVRQFAAVGVLAAVASAISYGVRPVFLEAALDSSNLPLTGTLIGAIAASVYAIALTRITDLRAGLNVRLTSFWLFLVSGGLQAIGFLTLTLGLSTNDVIVVYPVTASAPLFTVAFTALLLRGTEVVTWRIVLGAAFVVAGVVAL